MFCDLLKNLNQNNHTKHVMVYYYIKIICSNQPIRHHIAVIVQVGFLFTICIWLTFGS